MTRDLMNILKGNVQADSESYCGGISCSAGDQEGPPKEGPPQHLS